MHLPADQSWPLRAASAPLDLLPPEATELLASAPSFRGAIGPLSFDLFASDPRILALATGVLAHTRTTEALAHHIRVLLIDSAHSGFPTPQSVPGMEHLRIPLDEANFRVGGRVVAIHQAESCTWQSFDAASGIGFFYTADAGKVAPWEWAAPIKSMIAWATNGCSYGLLHGAVLARADGVGVTLAGNSGAGKSTTTAAGILRGLTSTGDDVNLIEWHGKGIAAHAAFDSLNVSPASLAILGGRIEGRGAAVGPGTEKHLLTLTEAAPGALRKRVELRALLLPRVAHAARSIISAASGGEAQRALGPVSAFVMRVAPNETYARAARLARDLPAFRLDLSDDPLEAADASSRMMEEL